LYGIIGTDSGEREETMHIANVAVMVMAISVPVFNGPSETPVNVDGKQGVLRTSLRNVVVLNTWGVRSAYKFRFPPLSLCKLSQYGRVRQNPEDLRVRYSTTHVSVIVMTDSYEEMDCPRTTEVILPRDSIEWEEPKG
jgi:hypothetical protein